MPFLSLKAENIYNETIDEIRKLVVMDKNIISNFYRLTIKERIHVLEALGLFDETLNAVTSPAVFENLIENYIATYEIGIGIAPNFLVDQKLYHVPLATEEPSVIAAASNAAKIIRQNGGFKTTKISRPMIGQIIFKNVKDQKAFRKYLAENEAQFNEVAKIAHPSIYKRGGGITKFEIALKGVDFVTLYAYIDTKDAMGANIVNTLLEAIAVYISANYQSEVLMAIVSNLALGSLVTTRVELDPQTLKHPTTIAKDIVDAVQYAELDPFRAATHNKGVMNGISALMLATGNDTRSIEAGAHAFASLSGTYMPLTKWMVIHDKLVGEITLPLALGTVGGAINVLPKAQLAYKILNIERAEELMSVTAAVGLAQNFAALYALTTDGINKGHMRLHARNIALFAGALVEDIDAVVNYMIAKESINVSTAKEFLKMHKIHQIKE